MFGIDLDKPIIYHNASLRFFREGEHHVSRICQADVLLLVYDGVLRFSEDGVQYTIYPGQYHIQKCGSIQTGEFSSDSPKYLYVHFKGEWDDHDNVLPRSGVFNYANFSPYIDELNSLSHSNAPYIIQAGKFYHILSMLFSKEPTDSLANSISAYITNECHNPISLDMLCNEFHYSKNHIINLCKKHFGMSPIEYTNHLRLKKAEYLLEVTSDSLGKISKQCGFQNYSYFYKLFIRKHHVSPEQWRINKRFLGSSNPF